MRILVDADACPVRDIIVKVARENNIPVVMFTDTSHIIDDGYSEIVIVDKARDSVDIALANRASPGDIFVSQDYGVAAMVLAKGAKAMNQYGVIYSEQNIDKLLFERHIAQKARRSGKRVSGAGKRKKQDDIKFENAFKRLLFH